MPQLKPGERPVSAVIDLSIFPVGRDHHLSTYVAPVVAKIASSGHRYQLTAMGTLVETEHLNEALDLINEAYEVLDALGCERVYATVKLDIRRGPTGRLEQKTASVESQLAMDIDAPAEATKPASTHAQTLKR
jgi:uncharacterized protein (TIGR00106 family)